MAQLEFEDLSFAEHGEKIRCTFHRVFYFDVDKKEFKAIGPYKLVGNVIEFPKASEKKARRKFDQIIESGLKNLYSKLSGKRTIYIYKGSGIPLMGTNYFGLIDRGSNTIEIKPLTGCNLGCIYCSVDEGPPSRRVTDMVVDPDYLAEELEKLIKFKNVDYIDCHINAQGETTAYAPMARLVEKIAKIPTVKVVSIDTNGTLWNKKYIDEMAAAGLTRFNLSLNAVDEKIAKQIAGAHYPVKRVMEMAEYVTSKMDLLIAPVWLTGFNDEEMPKLAKFAKKIGAGKNCPPIGIQNFLPYKRGRNPVDPVSLEDFFKRMKELEKKHDVSLLITSGDFHIKACREYPKPFKRGEIITVDIVCPGRLNGEMLGVAKGRLVAVPDCTKDSGKVRVKLKRTKHNIFLGEQV